MSDEEPKPIREQYETLHSFALHAGDYDAALDALREIERLDQREADDKPVDVTEVAGWLSDAEVSLADAALLVQAINSGGRRWTSAMAGKGASATYRVGVEQPRDPAAEIAQASLVAALGDPDPVVVAAELSKHDYSPGAVELMAKAINDGAQRWSDKHSDVHPRRTINVTLIDQPVDPESLRDAELRRQLEFAMNARDWRSMGHTLVAMIRDVAAGA